MRSKASDSNSIWHKSWALSPIINHRQRRFSFSCKPDNMELEEACNYLIRFEVNPE